MKGKGKGKGAPAPPLPPPPSAAAAGQPARAGGDAAAELAAIRGQLASAETRVRARDGLV